MRFALDHRDWQLRHWTPVLLTDESRFRLTRCDGRVRVYRRFGERYRAATIQEVDRFGRGSVMVWAGISIDNRIDLITSKISWRTMWCLLHMAAVKISS
jgi:hypothetical protein